MKKDYVSTLQYAFLAFALFLPLHEGISTIFILALVLITIYGIITKNLRHTKEKSLVVWIFPILFALYAVSVFVFSDTLQIKFLESKLSLLAFPFVFGYVDDVPKQKIYQFFVYGCLLAYIICMSNSVVNAFFFENGDIVFRPLKNPSRGFFEAIVFEGNTFFGRFFSILYHHTYFALYLSFGLLVLNIYREAYPSWFIWVCNIVFPLGIVQTMSMAGFGSLLIVALILVFSLIKRKQDKALLLAALISVFMLSMTFHPRIKLVINDLTKKELKLNAQSMDGVMLRLLSWDAALDIIKQNPVTGVGIGDAQENLNKIYEDKEYIHPYNRKLNAHNQYLQLFIECGVLGPLVLFLILFLLWKQSRTFDKRNKMVVVALMILMAFNFMFESLLSRYLGISFFVFFSCLGIYIPSKPSTF